MTLKAAKAHDAINNASGYFLRVIVCANLFVCDWVVSVFSKKNNKLFFTVLVLIPTETFGSFAVFMFRFRIGLRP